MTELQEKVDNDIAQRKKELINLKGLLLNAKAKNELLLAKCLVVMSYSHWEGFVKNATRIYMKYVQFQGLNANQYSQELRSALTYRQIMKNSDSVVNKILLTEDCLYNNKVLTVDVDDLCDTESNLNFDVLKKILYNVGLRSNVFDTKEIYINEKIVGDRNKFAHGEIRLYDTDDAIDIADTVINLMDTYRTEILNASAQNSFHS
ncbi:MAE_28990/MAE_18760 family HEPN-like nuclease [uncultured Prevotella sp.]|uniref:MAE_28990/MAE_18760 family HEPN-like nuclease n=1 Tax=uncultured Prevotella sp. TaxID=159272 RepID=UPI0025E21355|nr:MAE_28990/MAE_18760 family HEPN-like nuclease [uncultured Prevotella sp.]